MTRSANPGGVGRGQAARRTVLAATAAAAAAVAPGTAMATTGSAAAPEAARGRCDPLVPEPIPAQAPAREGFLDVPGARLWFWDTGGTGPAVVLVHPGSGSALSWPYQQPVFARAGYRVIAYSRRGHYNSSPPAPGNPGVGATDLHALVEHLGLRRFHLLGAALGGYYATDYALLHPGRLLSLVILSSFMGISDPEYLRVTERLRPPGFGDMPHDFLELSPYYRAANEEGNRQWKEISDRSLGGHSVEIQELSEPIDWPRLETLSVRTLLIAGDADLYLPPPILRMIAAHLPDAGTLVYSKVGHSANWERPSEFNRDVLRFWRGTRFPRESCR
ncbi:pimeloyl-ACP methyl ester carboxylesterase [Amycolatopsis cihanbeyliensis]|uniref:Pimeloyl-ACP methyl ester carboxylesterase n=1 Tax=Amycolatopsis cihanbeyliensis TaxID=1128664 RepID=A0A542DFA8_AMYCI|nr:pimeloyl-ACP methyl ester carboxylesterase [Amycolatopsis cihanbeyliensis]